MTIDTTTYTIEGNPDLSELLLIAKMLVARRVAELQAAGYSLTVNPPKTGPAVLRPDAGRRVCPLDHATS